MWIMQKDGDLINLGQATAVCVSSTRVTAMLTDGTSVTLASQDPEQAMARIVKAVESGATLLRMDK